MRPSGSAKTSILWDWIATKISQLVGFSVFPNTKNYIEIKGNIYYVWLDPHVLHVQTAAQSNGFSEEPRCQDQNDCVIIFPSCIVGTWRMIYDGEQQGQQAAVLLFSELCRGYLFLCPLRQKEKMYWNRETDIWNENGNFAKFITMQFCKHRYFMEIDTRKIDLQKTAKLTRAEIGKKKSKSTTCIKKNKLRHSSSRISVTNRFLVSVFSLVC